MGVMGDQILENEIKEWCILWNAVVDKNPILNTYYLAILSKLAILQLSIVQFLVQFLL